MTLLLAKTTGVKNSNIRLSERDFMINSGPIPLISPHENPIIGLLSDWVVLLKLFRFAWSCKVINYGFKVYFD